MDETKNVSYVTTAGFFHKPCGIRARQHTVPTAASERQMEFCVERIVVLSDAEYREYKASGLAGDQVFLFENMDKMWFDPAALCWHCLLIKGKTSKDGILVESEGYSYARYTAHIPDVSRLHLQGIPVQYEPPLKPPKDKTMHRRRGQER